MPILTEDMKDAIWKSFQETKRYKKTGELLDVDERTVAKVVREKKAFLAAKLSVDSQEGKPAKTTPIQNVDPVLEVQLRAYALFDQGHFNLQVAQELKLNAGTVMKYRKEFNDMKKYDLDQELEQKKREKMQLEELNQESQNELAQNQSEVQRARSEIKVLEDRRHSIHYDINFWDGRKEDLRLDFLESKKSMKNYKKRIAEAKQRCLELEKEERTKAGVPVLIKQMEALPVSTLRGEIDTFYNSNLFKKFVYEPMARAALCAIAMHPNRDKMLELLLADSGYNKEVQGYQINLGIGTEDYMKFVIYMAYTASFIIRTFVERSKSGTSGPIKIPDLAKLPIC
jgi:hypothetical protein